MRSECSVLYKNLYGVQLDEDLANKQRVRVSLSLQKIDSSVVIAEIPEVGNLSTVR